MGMDGRVSDHIPVNVLVQKIRDIIGREQLLPGEKLDTERHLAACFHVTRYDIQSALSILESDKEIIRKIGRDGGIFVSDGRLERNFNTLESLPVIAKRQGLEITSRVLKAETIPAAPSDIRVFSLDDANPTIYSITRLRSTGDRPLSLEANRFPAKLFPDLLDHDLAQPLYAIFERYYRIRPANVDEDLESVLPNNEEACLLSIPSATPLIRIHRTTSDRNGIAFERSSELFIADRVRFTMHHSGYVRLSATR
ncbi:GntR family transcriptional regulator [Bifidobacterium amazonense]|uniref:GntR family transcriptional regulator n=1 Tax=Bifidobacterium amazonense TaxID=2809027 RepID=A0ABS9VSN5_9BIFI|nr:GntR family transcriptional regulator [Bifidobacterium amazonense]MCH9275088.1 GntR family transcriptional regulator [Bifidobacterium amazonense]